MSSAGGPPPVGLTPLVTPAIALARPAAVSLLGKQLFNLTFGLGIFALSDVDVPNDAAGRRPHLNAATPARAMSSSSCGVLPLTPIAPITFPSYTMGSPP